jgi:hypothetical protein
MQLIEIIIQDEQGNLLKDSGINFAPILKEVYKIDDEKKSCALLWKINPYGDTTFKPSDLPLFISQLQSLEFSEENKNTVERVIKFLDEAGVNTEICFIGD